MDQSQNNYNDGKKLVLTGYKLCGFILHDLEKTKLVTENRLVIGLFFIRYLLGVGEECDYSGKTEGVFCGEEMCYDDCDTDFHNLYMG